MFVKFESYDFKPSIWKNCIDMVNFPRVFLFYLNFDDSKDLIKEDMNKRY